MPDQRPLDAAQSRGYTCRTIQLPHKGEPIRIIDYHESDRQPHWLVQIKNCDWRAGGFLAELLESGRFYDTVGEKSRLLLLTEGDALLSFATYAQRDCIDDSDLTPWLGFVYTYPAYRGQRLMGRLIEHIAARACAEGHKTLYVCTDHDGLYEKYGFTLFDDRMSIYGEMGHVLRRELPPRAVQPEYDRTKEATPC